MYVPMVLSLPCLTDNLTLCFHLTVFLLNCTETREEPPLTLPDCQRCSVDQEQQDVVEKALKHRGVGMVIIRKVFAGQANPTDEQR